MNRIETLRDSRLRLNQIEHWLKGNPHRFAPTHLVVLRSVMEDTATPFHVRTMEAYMREWMLPETQDRPPSQPMDSSMINAPSAST